MTNKEFENYLALVSRLLRLKRGQCEQIAVELRDHLELRVAELTQSGIDPDEATRRALEEFGDAASLAGQFQFITESYQKRWMMRFATLSVAGLFLAVILVMAMWPGQARFGSPDSLVAKDMGAIATVSDDEITMSDNTQRNIEIRKRLSEVASFDFDETPFIDVMSYLTDQYGINVVLDMTARDDSLSEDEPVRFKVSGIPANKALRLMLPEYNATYMIKSGVLRIISLDVESDPDYFSRQIFDVSSLLKKISILEKHRIGTVKKTVSTTGGHSRSGGGVFCVGGQESQPEAAQGGLAAIDETAAGGDDTPAKPASQQSAPTATAGGGGGGFGGGTGSSHYEVEIFTAENMLVDLVKTSVAPDSWSNTNGDGTLEILGGLMIVVQSEAINEQIEELLQDLNYRYAKILKTTN